MIIQRYLYREIIQSFAGVLAVLLLIFVSNRFVRYLSEAAAGELSSNMVLQVMGLKLVTSLPLIIPLAFFLSVLLAMGRLYRDSEMTAVAAGGVGVGRFLVAVFWLSLLFAGLVAVISMYFAPQAEAVTEELEVQADQGDDITGLVSGRFKEFSDGKRVFYARDISSDLRGMRDLFVKIDRQDADSVMASEAGYQYFDRSTGDRFMVMTKGYRYEGNPGQADYTITRFDKQAVRIRNNPVIVQHVPSEAMQTQALLASSNPRARAELHWRLAMPVSLVLLGLLAVLLAKSTPRQGRYAKLFNATLLYILYSNLLGVARELTEKKVIPPELGLWPVHAVVILLVLGMYFFQSRFRWRLAAWSARRRVTE